MQGRVGQLVRHVRLSLGQDAGYGVGVELSDGQIAHAIRLTFSLYNYHFPIQSHQSHRVTSCTAVITPDPPIRGILDLSIINEQDALLDGGVVPSTFTPFDIPGSLYTGLTGNVTPDAAQSYATYLEWRRATREVFSTMNGWFFDERLQKLYVYAPIPPALVHIKGTIDYDTAFDEEEMWGPDEADEPDTPSPVHIERLEKSLGEVPHHHIRWFRTGSLAHSKRILGRMLRKYSSVPGTDDRDVQLDGSDLVQEGQQELELLQEDIRYAEGEAAPMFF